VIDISQQLWLGGELLGPFPLPRKLIREVVAILHALHVDPCTGVAVPIPGPADTAAGLEGSHSQSALTQAMKDMESSEASTDD